MSLDTLPHTNDTSYALCFAFAFRRAFMLLYVFNECKQKSQGVLREIKHTITHKTQVLQHRNACLDLCLHQQPSKGCICIWKWFQGLDPLLRPQNFHFSLDLFYFLTLHGFCWHALLLYSQTILIYKHTSISMLESPRDDSSMQILTKYNSICIYVHHYNHNMVTNKSKILMQSLDWKLEHNSYGAKSFEEIFRTGNTFKTFREAVETF